MPRWRWSLYAAAAALVAGLSVAHAAPPAQDRSQAMTVALVREARPGCAPGCAVWIAARGRIVSGSQIVLDRVLRTLGTRRPPILIDSLGGSVEEAMAMGRAIRARHLDVTVAQVDMVPCDGVACRARGAPLAALARGDNAVCASACTLVLAAGTTRKAAAWSLVGVHQMVLHETLTRTERIFRTVTRQDNGEKVVLSRTLVGQRVVSSTHVTIPSPAGLYRTVAHYLAGMGVDASIIPLMLATPPSGIHWMTPDERASTHLVTDRAEAEMAAEVEANRQATLLLPVDALAERATLEVDGLDPARPVAFAGRVVWSLDPGPQSAPDRAVLRAAIDLPDAGLTATLRMTDTPNPDHVAAPRIELAFKTAPAGVIRAIDEVSMPLTRVAPSRDIVPLAGSSVPEASVPGTGRYAFQLATDDVHGIVNAVGLQWWPSVDIPMRINGGATARLRVMHATWARPLVERALDAWTRRPPAATVPPPRS